VSALSGEGGLPWKLWAPGPRKETQHNAGPEGNRPDLTGGLEVGNSCHINAMEKMGCAWNSPENWGPRHPGIGRGLQRNSPPKSFEDPRNSVILLGGVVGSAMGAPVPGVPVQGFRSFPGVAPGETGRLPGKGYRNRVACAGNGLKNNILPYVITGEGCLTRLSLPGRYCSLVEGRNTIP
jgi:hypothetical protein